MKYYETPLSLSWEYYEKPLLLLWEYYEKPISLLWDFSKTLGPRARRASLGIRHRTKNLRLGAILLYIALGDPIYTLHIYNNCNFY